MKYTQNFSEFESKLFEKYLNENLPEIEVTLEQINEGLAGLNLGIDSLGSWLFPNDLTTEQLIVKYAQYASLIASFIPGIGSAASIGIEVILVLYWLYKYSTAKDEVSQSEAMSELIIGLFVVAITALMVPGGRLLKGPIKSIFKIFSKPGARNKLAQLSVKEIKTLQKLSGKMGPALSKTKQVLGKAVDKLEPILPKKAVNAVKNNMGKFDDAMKQADKLTKGKIGTAATKALTKADDVAIDAINNASKGKITKLNKLLKSKDKSIRNALKNPANHKKIKVNYRGKNTTLDKAIKDVEKNIKTIGKNQIKASDGLYIIDDGVPKKTLGKKLLSAGKTLITLPFKIANFGIYTVLRVFTTLNRQYVYVLDEEFTDGKVMDSIHKKVKNIPGFSKSAEYLAAHPELVVMKYQQKGVNYFEMNHKTDKRTSTQTQAEFIGMKVQMDDLTRETKYRELDVQFSGESEGSYIDYYTVVSSNSTPELSALYMFALEKENKNSTPKLYAANIDEKNKSLDLTPIQQFEDVESAEIISLNEATVITQQNYKIVDKRIKDYEEDERPEQKQLSNILGLLGKNRMSDTARKKFRRLFMRDVDDFEKAFQEAQ